MVTTLQCQVLLLVQAARQPVGVSARAQQAVLDLYEVRETLASVARVRQHHRCRKYPPRSWQVRGGNEGDQAWNPDCHHGLVDAEPDHQRDRPDEEQQE